jgi:hypothetical protein
LVHESHKMLKIKPKHLPTVDMLLLAVGSRTL